ncbi:MAG TPA: hypothetical protein VK457_11335 [Chloroflexota bacterium]|nr:hypothetical protein [Chloroflexota bacterium]
MREPTNPRLVMIVDRDEGQARLLSIDEFGLKETPLGSLEAIAGEVLLRKPDLILVHPGALTLAGDKLVSELNRRARFEPGYAWTPAPGELAGS